MWYIVTLLKTSLLNHIIKPETFNSYTGTKLKLQNINIMAHVCKHHTKDCRINKRTDNIRAWHEMGKRLKASVSKPHPCIVFTSSIH